MKVRLLFLATLVSSKNEDEKEKQGKKQFDEKEVVAQALENVRKIFKDINTENGREKAIKWVMMRDKGGGHKELK